MDKKVMTFGDFVKQKRMGHEPRITLRKMAEAMNVTLTYLSDVENNRKRPFSGELIEKFCEELGLSDEDRFVLYDLAARDKSTVPDDIVDTIMYTEEGDLARKALRMVSRGNRSTELWKELIRKMEESE